MAAETGSGDPLARELSRGRVLWLRGLGHQGFLMGAVVLGVIVMMAVFAPLLAPMDPFEQNLSARLIPPVWDDRGSWAHPLGTDHLGRDYLSRLIYGAQISLLIGIGAAFISGIIGTLMGVAAGYFGGRVDMVISFIITARLATPVILVALAIVAMIGASLEIVIAVLGLLLWDRYALVMRATTQQICANDYITAAKAQGCSLARIVVSEILPNLANNLIVVATLEVANAIILEAALSFLGLGVPPPLPSWGLMVSEGKSYILFDPWLITIPGVMLFLLVLAINLVGDGIRDVTSPEGRN